MHAMHSYIAVMDSPMLHVTVHPAPCSLTSGPYQYCRVVINAHLTRVGYRWQSHLRAPYLLTEASCRGASKAADHLAKLTIPKALV